MEPINVTHKKLRNHSSDSVVVINELNGDNKREKTVAGRTHSLPGEPHRYQPSLKRSRGSTRRSYRGHSSSREHFNNDPLGTHSKAKTDLLIQNANSLRVDPEHSPASLGSFKFSNHSNYSSHVRSPSVRSSRSRSSFYKDRGRRQSAWSGEQMKGDFAEIVHKYANPQSIFSISVILVVTGIVCIVVSIGSSSKVLNIIGITFIVLGVLVFIFGATWFYFYRYGQGSKSKMHARLKLVQLQYMQDMQEEKYASEERDESDTPADL